MIWLIIAGGVAASFIVAGALGTLIGKAIVLANDREGTH